MQGWDLSSVFRGTCWRLKKPHQSHFKYMSISAAFCSFAALLQNQHREVIQGDTQTAKGHRSTVGMAGVPLRSTS